MKQVAKLVIIDEDESYLLLTLSNHPHFGNSDDLPGGTVEEGEAVVEGLLREVSEEIGVVIDKDDVKEIYSGTEYSRNGTLYVLFLTRASERPEITLSWEHTTYEWLPKREFIQKARSAKDTYMHMVADKVEGLLP